MHQHHQCATATSIATELPPYCQGDLDGLCGPYALINALRVTLEPHRIISDDEARDLLRQMVDHAIPPKQMAASLREGITWPKLRKMAMLVAELATDKVTRVQLIEVSAPNEAERWETLSLLVEAGSPVLFHDNTIDHYTVTIGLTVSRVRLYEGDGQHWLPRVGLRLRHAMAFIVEPA
ncbi:MAG: hypothetical protein HEQ21_07575 [Blastomonas sp.]|uniref:hypothetical protein n=1 Tax=Blastomonas sp. TaxID=1909299 RepID=UPI002583F21D|nr:hypothetical protein [Blastomonas sp.]MCO5792663.1 hypothetical protein [Blastomonas sp.]